MMIEKMPFKEGLFGSDDGESWLLGNKCTDCGQIFFPAKPFCFECRNRDMASVKFGRKGRLYSYAVSHLASCHFTAPYVAGWVDCDEGVRVFAPLVFENQSRIDIGMDLVLDVREFWREDNRSVLGYLYVPAAL